MTAQLSPERAGRITASRIAAVLGVDRYRTRDDLLREMVREHFGAVSEFTGNEATEWGNAHEEDARAGYERTTGRLVLDAQDFVKHPEVPWLGCSPDGLVDDDGMAEFKCPWRARYRSIVERPNYQAQVQHQLACTERAWCDFVIWRPGELLIERVPAEPGWLASHLDTLTAFYDELQATVADPERAARYLEAA